MFLFVLARASEPMLVPGAKEGMIVYLQDDRKELCLLTYTTPHGGHSASKPTGTDIGVVLGVVPHFSLR